MVLQTRRSFLKSLFWGAAAVTTGIKLSANTNQKTVYYYKDIHSGSNDGAFDQPASLDFLIIDEFCTKNNIKTICIEGWAGNEADKQRGFVLLNAERLLIQKLWSTKYKIVPLEAPNLQYNALRSMLLGTVMSYRNGLAIAYRYSVSNNILDEKKLQKYMEMVKSSAAHNLSQINVQELAKQLNMRKVEEPFDYYVDQCYNVFEFERKLYDTYTQPDVWTDFNNRFERAYHSFKQEEWLKARNEYAVSVIEKIPDEKVLVVFGAAHFEGISKLLGKRNIICTSI